MTEQQISQLPTIEGTPLELYIGQCEAYGAYIDELKRWDR